MAEYIEREAAKKEFCLYFGSVSHAAIAVRLLDEIPAADVVPVVHGRWIKTDRGMREVVNTGEVVRFYLHDCSVCGYHTGNQGRDFNFCPICGARMDGE